MSVVAVTAPSPTAADVMTRESKTVPAGMPLREAVKELSRLGAHWAPVVDEENRLVGILSMGDLARWTARQAGPSTPLPKACSYQEAFREPGGWATVLCHLRPGACALQRFQERACGQLVTVCADPHGVCTDWQVIELESLPTGDVRHYMTTGPVTVRTDTPVPATARLMLERALHQVVVVDAGDHPVGVVSVSDILGLVAGLKHTGDGDTRR
jgi:CBS domain-containing protein